MSDTVSPPPSGCTARVPIDDAAPVPEPLTASVYARQAAVYAYAGGLPAKPADRLSASAVCAVLGALMFHADHDGGCWPSVGRLARLIRLEESTVRRALAFLAADGVLERTRQHRANGFRKSDHLRLDMARLLAAGDRQAEEELEHDLAELDDAEQHLDDFAADADRADEAARSDAERLPGLRHNSQPGLRPAQELAIPELARTLPLHASTRVSRPAAGEGKAKKQQPTDLQCIALRLPASLAGTGPGELYDPDDAGRRTNLVSELAEARKRLGLTGAELAELLTARSLAGVQSVDAVLGQRLADLVAAGAPIDLDELAAAEAEAAHAQRLEAAANAGRTLAAVAIANGAPPSTIDVDEEAARQYPHDLELRGAFVDAYRAAIARSALTERPASRPRPADAPTVPVDEARARIARMAASLTEPKP